MIIVLKGFHKWKTIRFSEFYRWIPRSYFLVKVPQRQTQNRQHRVIEANKPEQVSVIRFTYSFNLKKDVAQQQKQK